MPSTIFDRRAGSPVDFCLVIPWFDGQVLMRPRPMKTFE
jgi:hypothetical protein